MMAPGYVGRAINRRLDAVPGYGGHVGGIGLHLWRGAYRIDDIVILKSNGQVKEPFFAADRIDFSIAWREIFHGKLVSDIVVTNGHLNFLRGKSEETSQLNADKRWQDVINDIFPIVVTRLEIKGGVLRFVDVTHDPHVDVSIHDLSLEATGLRNRPSDYGEEFPASIRMSGRTIGGGELALSAKLEPLADKPNFAMSAKLTEVALPALNDLMQAYVDVDVSKGRFEAYCQMAMREGHYEGYVKPFLDHVEFKDTSGERKSLGQRLWQTLVAAFFSLAKNAKSQQIATRIPFSGDSGSLDVHTWRSIVNGLHHGFIQALAQNFEGTTHPDDKQTTLPAEPVKPDKDAPVAAGKQPAGTISPP